mmetsp:Transcript_22656/g.57389  ORF Transcript_22656/g.57389 Transcript_22656/m.57389 type:complete len:340 (-) Transcript_22656:174-1193(-)|eukprot:CAMPEP_0178988462 /NCGR_PEP_ID=MMETSP0795-20121207/3824_1 /TAXON_ID=88552 /ORGANISM="Amoebophrya sp., Strain Ameob2" /LENGTH=339 /DNA_ID=CAMNT_0020679739 /DNA_START=135 /DNA_END=1154 /DNA_ORIENTATION=-
MSGPNTEAQLPLYAIRSGMQSIANVAQLAVDQKLLAVDFGALISRKIDRLRQDWQLCDDHGDDKIDHYERPSYDDAPGDAEPKTGGEGSGSDAKAKANRKASEGEAKVKKAATSKKTGAGADAKLEKDQKKKPKFSTDACRFVLRDANYIQKLRELAGVHQVLVRRALTLLNARHRAMAGNFERFVRLRNVAASEPERLTLSGMKRTLLEKYSHILEAEGHATSDQGELGAEDYPSVEGEGRRNLDPQQGGNHVRLTTDEQELLDRVLPVSERSPLHFSKATRVKKKAHPEYDVNMEKGGGLFYKTLVDDGDGFDLDHGEEPPPKPPPGLKGEAGKIFL